MIEIVVLGRPRGKQRPRFSKLTGRAYTPAQTASFEALLKYAASETMRGRAMLEGPVGLDMVIGVPIAKSWSKTRRAAALTGMELPVGKPDWDNYGKTVDALNLVVWADDSQVVDGRVRKFYAETPGTWIRVWSVVPTPLAAFPPPVDTRLDLFA